MVSLMQRRREMMQMASSPTPEWDVEWDYTDGSPTTDGLFSLTTSGTTGEQLSGNSWRMRTYRSGASMQYAYAGTHPPIAVFEVKFQTGSSNNFFNVMSLSNGTGGITVRFQYSSSYKGIYLCDYGSPFASGDVGSMTKLSSSFALSTEYTIKLVLNGTSASIYVNDALLQGSIAISNLYAITDTVFYLQNRSSGNMYTYLEYMKLRLGRI